MEKTKKNREEEVSGETPQVVQQPFSAETVNIPNEYKPISMWGYFGYEILFLIPCIGFILLCVFSFGGTTNVNLKNFARSYFCFMIVALVLLAIVFGILMLVGVFAAGASTPTGGFGNGWSENSAIMP